MNKLIFYQVLTFSLLAVIFFFLADWPDPTVIVDIAVPVIVFVGFSVVTVIKGDIDIRAAVGTALAALVGIVVALVIKDFTIVNILDIIAAVVIIAAIITTGAILAGIFGDMYAERAKLPRIPVFVSLAIEFLVVMASTIYFISGPK